MFHRLVVPTYFGGLPVSGYDYINNPPLNGDAGVAASADGKKASGVNAGTYLVAFQEDALSAAVNRGFKALAENTDMLDDLFHRDIAVTVRTSDVTAAAPVSSIVLAGQVFVGENGVSNNQAQRDLLVSILDSNDHEILVGDVEVKAALIHNGSSTNVVGTQASGFFNTPTVNLNVAIPIGVTYRVYYGERSNLAALPKDALTNIRIRGAQEVDADVERTLRDLHAATGATWNGPWLATINSLVRTGLDGRYRLTTSDPGGSPAADTPGNGAVITRDGQALTMSAPNYDLSTVGAVGGTRYPDSVLASFRLRRAAPAVGTTWNTSLGGDVGLYQESPFHTTADANEVAHTHVSGPLLLDVIPRDVRASTLSSDAVLTRINSTGVATVNPTSGTDATSRRTIDVAASDFVRDGSSRAAIRVTDLVEVTDNGTGLVLGTFRVDQLISATRFTVRSVTGAAPFIGPSGSPASVRLRWLQPVVWIGGQQAAGSGAAFGTPSFMVAQPSPLVSDWLANNIPVSALFLSAFTARTLGVVTQTPYTSLAWGGFGLTGNYTANGALLGDGGIECNAGRQRFNVVNTISFAQSHGSGAVSVDLDPQFASEFLIHPSGDTPVTVATTVTLALSATSGYAASDGDELSIWVNIPTGTTGPFSITWPGDFKFSGSDGIVPSVNLSGTKYIIKYTFKYRAGTGFITAGWYATRTDYTL